MTPLRVAFFTDSFHEVNGVALTSREFVGFARRRSMPLFSVHAGPVTRCYEEGSIRTWEFKRGPIRWNLERDLAIDFLVLRYRNQLLRLLDEFRPDVVHITGPGDAGILGALAAYELKVPLSASWHTNLHQFAHRRLMRFLWALAPRMRSAASDWVEGWVLDRCVQFYRFPRMVFAPNPELVDMLAQRTGRPAFLMRRGIDAVLFSPERRARTGVSVVIGHVGRLSPEKNVRMLVGLERALTEGGLGDFQMLIVGDGSERGYLSRNLRRARLTGVLRGEELARAYASMDFLVFPSSTDTFGNVVLEAMASGAIPIVSAGGGPKYVVDNGVTGIVVSCEHGFARAILDLCSDPIRASAMKRAARSAAEQYTWDSVFERMYERYPTLAPDSAVREVSRTVESRERSLDSA